MDARIAETPNPLVAALAASQSSTAQNVRRRFDTGLLFICSLNHLCFRLSKRRLEGAQAIMPLIERRDLAPVQICAFSRARNVPHEHQPPRLACQYEMGKC